MEKSGTRSLERRSIRCQEETEQDQKVRALDRVEAWVEAAAVAGEVVVKVKAAAVAGEVVLPQARAVFASAPTVAKEQPINWGAPVMSSDVLNAEQP